MSDSWLAKTDAPASLYWFPSQAAVIGDSIYMTGGFDGSSFVATTYAYNTVSDTWTSKASMPAALNYGAVGVVDGKIYAIQGANALYEYNPSTDSWTAKTVMPGAVRYNFQASVVEGIIYVTGGRDNAQTTFYDLVYAYDPSTDTWTQKTSMPTVRAYHATATVGGLVYVAAGVLSAAGGDAGEVHTYAYDPVLNSWTQKASMSLAHQQGSFAGSLNGRFVVFGSVRPESQYAKQIVAYNPTTDSWTAKTRNEIHDPNGRSRGSGAVVDGKFYALLGDDANANARAWTDQYEPDWAVPSLGQEGWGMLI